MNNHSCFYDVLFDGARVFIAGARRGGLAPPRFVTPTPTFAMHLFDDLHVFITVVQCGGLAAAGRKLGVSPAGMTAKIQNLEQKYQAQLLERTTRSIRLTEAGKIVYGAALRIQAEYRQVSFNLGENKNTLAGPLRIDATKDFGTLYVAPALAQFARLHPEVRPVLTLSDATHGLIETETDLLIRIGALVDSGVMARKLVDNCRVLCASKKYLKTYGTPKKPQDLLTHRCLVMATKAGYLCPWFFFDKNNEMTHRVDVRAAMVANDGMIVRQWVKAGAGIAAKSVWDIKQDMDSGELSRVLKGYTVGFNAHSNGSAPIHCLYPSRNFLPKRVSQFIDYLKESLGTL